ncbi:unnamed protein product [Sphenostylis stenocarpa]|uniref:Uncharacterized protein n=1 Tax=Sphenostylis stenocarpa TaxID=92480 RepID=A0AA86S924_9FABA|nr:unnamed protein product [Sphenostylis stenocarpa]
MQRRRNVGMKMAGSNETWWHGVAMGQGERPVVSKAWRRLATPRVEATGAAKAHDGWLHGFGKTVRKWGMKEVVVRVGPAATLVNGGWTTEGVVGHGGGLAGDWDSGDV